MNDDIAKVMRLFGETLRDPQGVALGFTGVRLPHAIGWSMLAAATILATFLVYLNGMMVGWPEPMTIIRDNPIGYSAASFGVAVVLIFLLYYAGRTFGGVASFGPLLLLMAWFHVVVFILLLIQMIAGILLPGVGGVISLAVFALEIYVLVQFLKVAQGFATAWQAFGLLIAASVGVAIGLTFIIMLIGGAAAVGGTV